MSESFAEDELRDIGISIAVLALAFAIMFYGRPSILNLLAPTTLIPAYLLMLGLVAVSFLPHQIAHRAMARAAESHTEYRRWNGGLILGLLTSLLGFVFAAPGGVRIWVHPSERFGRKSPSLSPGNMSLVSLMGPLMNISMVVVFVFLAGIADPSLLGMSVFMMGAKMNAFMALSSLVPVYPMDGYRVLRAEELFWFLGVLLAVVAFIVAYGVV